jgi:hypothetical protein
MPSVWEREYHIIGIGTRPAGRQEKNLDTARELLY